VHSRAAELRPIRLQPLPEIDLHLGESPGLSRGSGDRVLKNGDIINLDITTIKEGYHGDTSRMFVIGEGSDPGQTPVRNHL
jgi:methionine aminopeptidase